MVSLAGSESPRQIPRIPASASALIFDNAGRLLTLKPNYKAGWTIPGGQIEETGESPWQGCQRETLEECGLQIEHGRLALHRVPAAASRPARWRALPVRLRTLPRRTARGDHHRRRRDRRTPLCRAGRGRRASRCPVRRRVLAAVGRKRCVYLEGGRRVKGVRSDARSRAGEGERARPRSASPKNYADMLLDRRGRFRAPVE